MALESHVQLTLTNGNVGVARLAFGIPLILSVNAAWAERFRTYTDTAGVLADFASTSPEYLAAVALLSQAPHPVTIVIGRALGQPTQRYQINVTAVTTGATYAVNAAGQGVTATTTTYIPAADLTISTVTFGTDLFTLVAHGMLTGDGPYRYSAATTLPTGLAVDTDYWVIRVDADNFKLASSKANAVALIAIDITGNGSGTQTLRRSQNDVICAQLVQGLNAVVNKNFTATQTTGVGETDFVVVTGNAPGNWFSLEETNVLLMKIAQTHAEPATTLVTDIAAIRTEYDSWYLLYTLYNSDAYVKAAAAAIEPLKKFYVADLSNSESATLADNGSDTGDALQTLAYRRTATVYHPAPRYMSGAAWAGARLPYDPGAATWKFSKPSGVPAVNLTSTQETNLVAKNINFLQTTAGLNIMREGITVGGEFIDKIRDLDWLEDDLTKAVFETLAGTPKVPYTNAGGAMIEAAVRGSLTRAYNMGIIDKDFIITVPKVLDASVSDRALRILRNVKFSARMQGAIHSVKITGVISV